ncbi:MAG: NMD3-related protein [Candidatus Altiarchaeota archaeon]|nr:NMD3-related protein [Candidatus Altiarchaeota archaeon]
MFCPKCGRETREKGLCRDCFLKAHPIGIKKVTLPLCKCGRYLYRGRWIPDLNDSLEKIVRDNLVLPLGVEVRALDIKPVFKGNKILLEIHVTGEYGGGGFREEIQAEVRIQSTVCPACSRISGGYYEAVLQVRTAFDPLKMLDSEFISKVESVRGGFDVYVTSSNYARKVSSELSKKGFLVKESKKLVGMRKGEILYRGFTSIKSPKFRVGDFLGYRNKILQVLKLGKSVHCRNIRERKTLMMPLPKLQRAELIAPREDVRKALVSSVAPNWIQVMDLESFKTFELPGTFKGLKEKDEVEYLKVGRDVYLL